MKLQRIGAQDGFHFGDVSAGALQVHHGRQSCTTAIIAVIVIMVVAVGVVGVGVGVGVGVDVHVVIGTDADAPRSCFIWTTIGTAAGGRRR